MGQYYMPTLIDEEGNIQTLYSHDYGNGLKLMEHSYIGNSFVNAVLTLMWHNPMRLAWIGDYSDDQCGDPYENKLPREEFLRYYEAAWKDEEDELVVHPKPRNVVTMKSRRYIVNHTRCCYISLKDYIAKNKWSEKGGYENGQYNPLATWDMCVHPLPLLTACGNGRGGGDYHEQYPNYDRVGEWAFDLIECNAKKPAGYEKLDITFTEQHEAA